MWFLTLECPVVANSTFYDFYGSQNKLRLFPYAALNEMDGACGTFGGEERRIQGFGGET
jgi:hypothetical protein